MHKKSLVTLFLVVFIDLVGFGMVIPILPYYAHTFGGTAFDMGLLMMSYSAMQFIFSPFWGNLSDKIGRRPVLIICITGIGVSMLLLGLAQSLGMLFMARILAGFFGANISAASAFMADITPPEERAKGMGLIGAAFGLGFLFGPALVGLLGKLGLIAKFGYASVGFSAAILALFNLIFALSSLKENPLSVEARKNHRHINNKEAWIKTLAYPKTALPVFLFFLVTFAFAHMESTFGFYLLKRFGLDAEHASLILALMALVMVLIQGGLIGKLSKKWGEINLALTGTVLMGISLACATAAPNLGFFIFFFIFLAMGSSFTNPSLSSLLSKNADPTSQGLNMGIYQSAGSLARLFAPPLAGFTFDRWGIHTPFLIAAFIFCMAFVVLFKQRNIYE